MININSFYVSLLIFFLGAGLLTYISIAFFYPRSFKLGLVDSPGGRKKHEDTVPLIGGISIFIGVSVINFFFMPYSFTYFVFWLVTFFLFLLAMLDDLRGIEPSYRLFIQFLLVCMISIFGKTTLFSLGNLLYLGEVKLGIFSLFMTGFTVVGIMNAVNMMDGVDGLTGSISLVEFICMLFLTITLEETNDSLFLSSIIGAILVFLFYNFPSKFSKNKKVFLGDVGSLLIGLSLAWFCIRLTQGEGAHISPVLMLWIVALPLMDALHVMANRKSRGVSLFKADRRHIHHILLNLNYTVKQVVIILMSFSFIVSSIGILLYFRGASDGTLFLGILLVFCVYSFGSYKLKKKVSKRHGKLWVRLSSIGS